MTVTTTPVPPLTTGGKFIIFWLVFTNQISIIKVKDGFIYSNNQRRTMFEFNGKG
jgi:hypothetical protein